MPPPSAIGRVATYWRAVADDPKTGFAGWTPQYREEPAAMDRFHASEFLNSSLFIGGKSVAFAFADANKKELLLAMPFEVFEAFALAVDHRAKQIEKETGRPLCGPVPHLTL